jgi:hypothetical protein
MPSVMNDGAVRPRHRHRVVPPSGRTVAADRAIPDADDGILMWRVRQGDAAAFASLYNRYAPQVYGLTLAILRDERLAEEATHDVFLGLWQRPQSFELGQGVFVGWLLRIARNRAIDLLRSQRYCSAKPRERATTPSAIGARSPSTSATAARSRRWSPPPARRQPTGRAA